MAPASQPPPPPSASVVGGPAPSPPPPPTTTAVATTTATTSNGNGNGYYPSSASIFLPLPTVTPPKPRYLDVISVYANGTTAHRQVRKSELAVELRCPTRDLRLLDTSFPSSGATFLARRNAIVLRMDRIRAVIRPDELILFDPFCKDAANLLPMLQQQLATVAALSAAATTSTSSGSISSGGSSSSAAASSSSVSPFELLALEAVLANVCHAVHERLQGLAPHIARILGDLKFRHGTLSSFPKLLDELLPLRNELSELHYTVQELRKVGGWVGVMVGGLVRKAR